MVRIGRASVGRFGLVWFGHSFARVNELCGPLRSQTMARDAHGPCKVQRGFVDLPGAVDLSDEQSKSKLTWTPTANLQLSAHCVDLAEIAAQTIATLLTNALRLTYLALPLRQHAI